MRTAVATFMALLLVCAFTAAAPAPDISGQWHGQVARGGGLTDYYFKFKVDGPKLTGTVDYPQGDYAYRMDIIDGKISGAEISFAVINKSMGPGGVPGAEVRWTFTGKVQGKEIAMTLERPATPARGPAAPGAPLAVAGAPPAAAGAPPAAPTRVEFTATRSTVLAGH